MAFYDHGEDASFLYLALEPFVRRLQAGRKAESMTLSYLVKEHRRRCRRRVAGSAELLDRSAKIDILRQITSAVQYLHGQRLLHRDLKPLNVLCGEACASRVWQPIVCQRSYNSIWEPWDFGRSRGQR